MCLSEQPALAPRQTVGSGGFPGALLPGDKLQKPQQRWGPDSRVRLKIEAFWPEAQEQGHFLTWPHRDRKCADEHVWGDQCVGVRREEPRVVGMRVRPRLSRRGPAPGGGEGPAAPRCVSWGAVRSTRGGSGFRLRISSRTPGRNTEGRVCGEKAVRARSSGRRGGASLAWGSVSDEPQPRCPPPPPQPGRLPARRRRRLAPGPGKLVPKLRQHAGSGPRRLRGRRTALASPPSRGQAGRSAGWGCGAPADSCSGRAAGPTHPAEARALTLGLQSG